MATRPAVEQELLYHRGYAPGGVRQAFSSDPGLRSPPLWGALVCPVLSRSIFLTPLGMRRVCASVHRNGRQNIKAWS